MGDIYTDPPESRNEALVKAIIDGTEYTDPPQSRNEAILKSIIDDTEYTDPPQSRMEDLLIQLKEGGGGGSGTINLIETVPTYTGTMTYDGTEQTATFNNYDSEKMTVSGNTATNAGTYTATFKPKKGYYWDNGDSTATNEPKTVTWSIAKVTVTIPTYSGGTLTYDGTEQTAQFSDYDTDYMTVSGNSATNAGDYTAVFSLLDAINYEWSDTTTADKSVSWSIGKATASITLSESAVTLNAETLYTDVSITATVGTGALSVASSDTTVATVGAIENDTFRITANNDGKSGNATVTVSMAESDNYTSASVTVAVNVAFLPSWSTGTDAEIADAIAKADRGEIDLYADAGWRVGDERVISLSAIASSGSFDGVSWSVDASENYIAQSVILVLLDAGTTSETGDLFTGSAASNYKLQSAVKNKDGSTRTNPAFLVGLKGTMYLDGTGNDSQTGYMNSTNTTNGAWGSCARRGWCNGAFRSAIPSVYLPSFKQFETVSGVRNSPNQVVNDYFTLAAAKELFGDNTYSFESENNALVQFEWYKTPANRTKKGGGWTSTYWTRSINTGYYSSRFCVGEYIGNRNASEILGISPFGCI